MDSTASVSPLEPRTQFGSPGFTLQELAAARPGARLRRRGRFAPVFKYAEDEVEVIIDYCRDLSIHSNCLPTPERVIELLDLLGHLTGETKADIFLANRLLDFLSDKRNDGQLGHMGDIGFTRWTGSELALRQTVLELINTANVGYAVSRDSVGGAIRRWPKAYYDRIRQAPVVLSTPESHASAATSSFVGFSQQAKPSTTQASRFTSQTSGTGAQKTSSNNQASGFTLQPTRSTTSELHRSRPSVSNGNAAGRPTTDSTPLSQHTTPSQLGACKLDLRALATRLAEDHDLSGLNNAMELRSSKDEIVSALQSAKQGLEDRLAQLEADKSNLMSRYSALKGGK